MAERMIPRADTTDGLDNLRRRLHASKTHAKGRARTDEELLDDEHTLELHALGTARGLELILSDPKFRKDFWAEGYEEWTEHISRNTNQWIGKRVWTFIVVFMVGAGIAYLARNPGVMK